MASGDFPATGLETRADWGYQTKDNLSNTLSADISSVATSLTLTSSAAFPASGWILIDSETIFYGANDTGTGVLSSLLRGQQGTTAASHTSGTNVYLSDSGGALNRTQIAVEALQTKVGINGSAVTTSLDFLAKSATARAYLNSAQSLNNVTTTKILLDTENWDTGGNFASNKFVAPVAGKYLVSAAINFVGNTTNERVASIFVNGSDTASSSVQGTISRTGVVVSNILDLAATDYVELYGYQSSGGSLALFTGTHLTYLSIALIKL